MSALVETYESLESWLVAASNGMVAASCGRRCLMLYVELYMEELHERNWQRTGFLVWRLYPKFHLLQHCLEDQVHLSGNPRESWCYCDESEIGAAVNVAESVYPSTLHKALIEKHRLS